MKTDTRLLKKLEATGLRLAPSQVWGSIRIVPVLRDHVREDLRFAQRAYGDDLTVVSLGGRAMDPGLKYFAYVPHGLVMSWGKGQAEAVAGTQLRARDGKQVKLGPISIRLLHRMVKREDGNQLRMLPLHLAMEGFLALHFGGPEVAWAEYSQEALSRGLSPRYEEAVAGWSSHALDGALRTFELHAQQVGVLLFHQEVLLSAFVVAHPDDYRALHRTLLEDFYGDLLLQYGFLGGVQQFSLSLDARKVASLEDLRAEVARMRRDWADFHGFMAGGLFGAEVTSSRVYDAGPFLLQRFVTSLVPSEENHLGEAIVRDDGTLEYLKTFRLSAAQTRRAYLLKQVSAAEWNLEKAAKGLGVKHEELVQRMNNAGFGYILKPHVLEAAMRRLHGGR